MFTINVSPRFGDTDMLGHINQTVPAIWFEQARNPFIRYFIPEEGFSKERFPFIMVHTEYDFVDQIFFHFDVEIRTWISRIGTKSFAVRHEAWQRGKLCATGGAVIVYYDFAAEKSVPIPEDFRKLLEEHLLP
jgi:acyl-CoA thioester hydrolase